MWEYLSAVGFSARDRRAVLAARLGLEDSQKKTCKPSDPVSPSLWHPRWNPMTRRPTVSGNLFSYLLRSTVWHSNNCLKTVTWNYRQRKWFSPVVLVGGPYGIRGWISAGSLSWLESSLAGVPNHLRAVKIYDNPRNVLRWSCRPQNDRTSCKYYLMT